MFPVVVAEFTPLSPQVQLAVVSLLGLALLVLAIRSHVRRQPPLDSELVKLSMAIAGLEETLKTLKGMVDAHASHGTQIEALQEKVRTLEQNREDDQRSNRTYTRESSERIFKKLDEIAASFALKVDNLTENFANKVERIGTSFSANVQKIEGAMGRLDGTCDQLSKRLDNLER